MNRETEPLLFDPDTGESLQLRLNPLLRAREISPCCHAQFYRTSLQFCAVQADVVNAFHTDYGLEISQVSATHNCDEKLLAHHQAHENTLPSLGEPDIVRTPLQGHERSVEVKQQRPGFGGSQARDDLVPRVKQGTGASVRFANALSRRPLPQCVFRAIFFEPNRLLQSLSS
jgi:hypothetical protein